VVGNLKAQEFMNSGEGFGITRDDTDAPTPLGLFKLIFDGGP
jgi:hypothetical protein